MIKAQPVAKPHIIFLHGLKTGGTSLRYMLLDEYGYEQVAPVPIGFSRGRHDYPVLKLVDPLEYQLLIKPEDVTRYQVVMSHYDWRIVERLPDWRVITMLRHPVNQIKSLYQYMVRSEDFPDFNPPPFMDWVRGAGQVYLNGQIKTLAGHHTSDLKIALRNLEDSRLSFGILEKFEASVWRWNRQFGWSMDIEHRNQAEKHIKLTALEFAEVAEFQRGDMQLYARAVELFEG
jgi:hypothetical protein